MKKCACCKNEFSENLFNKDKRRKDGIGSYCKNCANIIVKKSNNKNASIFKKKTYQRTCILCNKTQNLQGRPRSQKCGDCNRKTRGQRILNNNNRKVGKHGYYEIHTKYYRGYIHRLVVENHIGRKLLSTEHVHHIDGNKINNDINNLVIMTQADHMRLHLKKDVASKRGLLGAKKKWGDKDVPNV